MNAIIKDIKICGVTACVPQNVEDNYSFATILGERRVKKQVRLTGVQRRHTLTKGQRASDLVIHAAEQLLRQLEWEKESIGILIYVTQSGDYVIPSTAIALQDRLGLPQECVAFDINLGCSAFSYGIHTVASVLQTAVSAKRAICLISDKVDALSKKKEFDAETISFSMLSGSAGAAIALEKGDNVKPMYFGSMCDGKGFAAIIKRREDCDTVMQGNKVFDFAINDVSDAILQFKKDYNLTESDIDFYVFHQAQQLILDSITAACSLPEEKVLFSLREYGNTSGASLPLTLCANRERLQKKSAARILFCGFGVGLSCGIMYLELPTKYVFDVEETSEHYDLDKAPDKKLRECTVVVLDADQPLEGYLAKMLDDETAKVILCGNDKKKLKRLQKQMFWSTELIVYESEEDLIKQLVTYEEPITGIVGNIRHITSEVLKAVSFNVSPSIVLLSGNDQGDNDLKAVKNNLVSFSDKIRLNTIKYNEEDLEIVLQSWADTFLEKGMPVEMLLPNYIGNSVIWLLGKDARFINGSTVCVDK